MLSFLRGAGIFTAGTREWNAYWINRIINECKYMERKETKTGDTVPGCVQVLAIVICRKTTFDGLIESWEIVHETRETLVSQNIHIAHIDVLEHPNICQTPPGVINTKVLVDDGLICSASANLKKHKEEDFLGVDHVPEGNTLVVEVASSR